MTAATPQSSALWVRIPPSLRFLILLSHWICNQNADSPAFLTADFIPPLQPPWIGSPRRPVDPVNKLRRIGKIAIRQEKSGHQRRSGDAKTHGHLLHRAGDRARRTLLSRRYFCVHQRVHARILQRCEKTVTENFHND